MCAGLGITKYRNRAATRLSGGNKRKLSLSLALLGCPEVVVLDEMSAGVDAHAKRRLWKFLSHYNQSTDAVSSVPCRLQHVSFWRVSILVEILVGAGMCCTRPNNTCVCVGAFAVQSILLSTHSMEEATAVGTRVAILTGGTLQCVGTARELHLAYGFGYELEVRPRMSECTIPLCSFSNALLFIFFHIALPQHFESPKCKVELGFEFDATTETTFAARDAKRQKGKAAFAEFVRATWPGSKQTMEFNARMIFQIPSHSNQLRSSQADDNFNGHGPVRVSSVIGTVG